MKKAYFISSIVNMENLILNLMPQANASEEELRDKGELSTKFGEKLSWRYLCYVREHPTFWTVPTHILYGKKDRPSSFETICEFAQIRSAQRLPSEKRGASVLHSWANAISRWLDTALYLMSALGRNLNFNAVVCAEYFWRRAVERLTRKVKFDSQIHRSSRLCRQRALFKLAQLNLIGFLAATSSCYP